MPKVSILYWLKIFKCPFKNLYIFFKTFIIIELLEKITRKKEKKELLEKKETRTETLKKLDVMSYDIYDDRRNCQFLAHAKDLTLNCIRSNDFTLMS